MSNYNQKFDQIKNLLSPIAFNNQSLNFYLKDIVELEETLSLVFSIPSGISFREEDILRELKRVINDDILQGKELRTIFTSENKNEKIKHKFSNIKKIILLASAKGGVGKSTTAVNLALALAKLGHKVGLLDADIYGPTVPKLLNINQKPEVSEQKMLPIFKDGIYSISIGNIVAEEKAAIWRGPMITKALYQLFLGVKWPELDYLIVDMPPGTGDIYLSLAENFMIDGVILVTTPQILAVDILKKSINFFNITNITIRGIIENMSYLVDDRGRKLFPFGKNEKLDELGYKILGQVPITTQINYNESIENFDKIYLNIAKVL